VRSRFDLIWTEDIAIDEWRGDVVSARARGYIGSKKLRNSEVSHANACSAKVSAGQKNHPQQCVILDDQFYIVPQLYAHVAFDSGLATFVEKMIKDSKFRLEKTAPDVKGCSREQVESPQASFTSWLRRHDVDVNIIPVTVCLLDPGSLRPKFWNSYGGSDRHPCVEMEAFNSNCGEAKSTKLESGINYAISRFRKVTACQVEKPGSPSLAQTTPGLRNAAVDSGESLAQAMVRTGAHRPATVNSVSCTGEWSDWALSIGECAGTVHTKENGGRYGNKLFNLAAGIIRAYNLSLHLTVGKDIKSFVPHFPCMQPLVKHYYYFNSDERCDKVHDTFGDARLYKGTNLHFFQDNYWIRQVEEHRDLLRFMMQRYTISQTIPGPNDAVVYLRDFLWDRDNVHLMPVPKCKRLSQEEFLYRITDGKKLVAGTNCPPTIYFSSILDAGNYSRVWVVGDPVIIYKHEIAVFLGRRFNATIRGTSNQEADFQFLMAARTLIISPSTFAWWAAFLSSNSIIHFPIGPNAGNKNWCNMIFRGSMNSRTIYHDWINLYDFNETHSVSNVGPHNPSIIVNSSEAAARCFGRQTEREAISQMLIRTRDFFYGF
jgi:hypothetical protein